MEKTILLSTALAIGLVFNSPKLASADDNEYNNWNNYSSSSSSSNYSNSYQNDYLQQQEVPLTATSNVDSSANSQANGQFTSDSTSNDNTTDQASTLDQPVAQSPAEPVYNYQPAPKRHLTKRAHKINVRRHNYHRPGDFHIGPNLQVKILRHRQAFTPLTQLNRVAPMTMNNLLHASTANPLAGRRQHISKHIKKLPSVY